MPGALNHTMYRHRVRVWIITGDVLDYSGDVSWRSLLAQQDGVVSCIGGFGSNEVGRREGGRKGRHGEGLLVQSDSYVGTRSI